MGSKVVGIIVILMMTGCAFDFGNGKVTTKVNKEPVNCGNAISTCTARCEESYDEIMQAQKCRERCYDSEHQCRVNQPSEPVWETGVSF